MTALGRMSIAGGIMETPNEIETQMKLIARRTLKQRAQRNGEASWMAEMMLLESLMLVGAGIVLPFIKALFDAVAVVLDERRTTV
jgi:hypothetical protein